MITAVAAQAQAQQPRAPTWGETKCIRYKAAWGELMKRRGVKDLSADFLTRHDAFITQGCRESTHVCPRSDAELEVADMMVVAAMNGGMASTFPPFSCKR
jgi:hypothetical protein